MGCVWGSSPSPRPGPVGRRQSARAEADRLRIARVYALNRAAGSREREILRHHGDHSVNMQKLDDTDPEDGEEGTSLRDRPHDAGYLR